MAKRQLPTKGTMLGSVALDIARAKHYINADSGRIIYVRSVLTLLEAFVNAIEAIGPEVCEQALRRAQRATEIMAAAGGR